MIISKRTRVKDLIPLVRPERMKEFIESFPTYPLEKPILSMTVGEFSEIMLDENSYITKMLNPKERAYIAFGRLHQYSIEMKGLADYLKTMQLKLTQEEQAASRNVDLPSFVERMLLDTVSFFHLNSMAEAEKIPLADYLVVLKDSVATARYSRNYNKILEQKSKAHRKK